MSTRWRKKQANELGSKPKWSKRLPFSLAGSFANALVHTVAAGVAGFVKASKDSPR